MVLIDYSAKDNVLFYRCEKCGNINVRTAENMPQMEHTDSGCILEEGEHLSCYACDNIHTSEIPLVKDSEEHLDLCLEKSGRTKNQVVIKRWYYIRTVSGGKDAQKVCVNSPYRFWGEDI